MRANVYSMEALPLYVREAVHDGVEIVATHIGERVVFKSCRVKLVTTPEGTVNPKRIGLKNLDPLTELHIMAVPLDPGEGERIGIAHTGRGVGFVDISTQDSPLIRSTTAHEAAHSIGFVTDGAEHQDPNSSFHCVDDGCLMHHLAIRQPVLEPVRSRLILSRRIFSRKSRSDTDIVKRGLPAQDSFCSECQSDMRDNGIGHLNNLRLTRLAQKRI